MASRVYECALCGGPSENYDDDTVGVCRKCVRAFRVITLEQREELQQRHEGLVFVAEDRECGMGIAIHISDRSYGEQLCYELGWLRKGILTIEHAEGEIGGRYWLLYEEDDIDDTYYVVLNKHGFTGR